MSPNPVYELPFTHHQRSPAHHMDSHTTQTFTSLRTTVPLIHCTDCTHTAEGTDYTYTAESIQTRFISLVLHPNVHTIHPNQEAKWLQPLVAVASASLEIRGVRFTCTTHSLVSVTYTVIFFVFWSLSDCGWFPWGFQQYLCDFIFYVYRGNIVLILHISLYLRNDLKWNWHLFWERVSLLSTPAGLLSQSSSPPCT